MIRGSWCQLMYSQLVVSFFFHLTLHGWLPAKFMFENTEVIWAQCMWYKTFGGKHETIRSGLFDSVQIFLAFFLLLTVVSIHTTHYVRRGFTWRKISGPRTKLDGFDVKCRKMHDWIWMLDPTTLGKKKPQSKNQLVLSKCPYLTIKMHNRCLVKLLKGNILIHGD